MIYPLEARIGKALGLKPQSIRRRLLRGTCVDNASDCKCCRLGFRGSRLNGRSNTPMEAPWSVDSIEPQKTSATSSR